MAVHRINFKSLDDGFMYVEYAGTSEDNKPVYDGLATGSMFHEVDTTKVYTYNEDASSGSEWVEQIQLGNSGIDSVQSLSMSPSLNMFTPAVVNPGIESIEPVEDGEGE